jgi:hypothetical protein
MTREQAAELVIQCARVLTIEDYDGDRVRDLKRLRRALEEYDAAPPVPETAPPATDAASQTTMTIVMALRRYLPNDPERARWIRESIEKAVGRALVASRAEGLEAAARIAEDLVGTCGENEESCGHCETLVSVAARIRAALPTPEAPEVKP